MIANTRETRIDDKLVLINHDTYRIWIDGEEFPFLIEEPGPEVVRQDGHVLVKLATVVFASNVIIVNTKQEEDQ